MKSPNSYKLAEEMVARSYSKTWHIAKLEWDLLDVYKQDEPDICLCGHTPINEICILINKVNQNTAVVGNVCVKKFLGLPSDKIFQALKRIRDDDTKSLNSEAISYAYRKKWINDWELGFALDTIRKRKLTNSQLSKRSEINHKLIANMSRVR